MRLKTALHVYRQKGPDDGTQSHPEAEERIATQTLHMHLSPQQIRDLITSWELIPTKGRGIFLRTLEDIEQILVGRKFL